MRIWHTAALVGLLASTAASAATLYVAPGGSDANPGTADKPFATIERARDAIRSLKKAGPLPRGGVTVELRGGIYTLPGTFALTAEDSGTAEAPITYRARTGEEVRLAGGKALAGLKPVADAAVIARLDPAARGKVLCADLKAAGVTDLGPAWPNKFRGYAGWPELFFDGRRMTLARWPNQGYAHIAKVLDPGSKPRWNETPDRPGKFLYEGDRPERWRNADAVYLQGYWCFKWFDEVIKVAEIKPAEKQITLAAPHMYGIGGPSGDLYFALNLLEELDAPGEYYVDRKAGMLYFWPPANPQGKESAVSVLPGPLVSLTDVSHVTLRGLCLEWSRGTGLVMTGGTGNLVAGCTVRNVASTAIKVSGGMKHGVVSCDVYGIGASGIELGGGDRKTLTPCGHYAENNHIHHFAELVYTYQNGIHLSGVGCRAAHNLLHDTPHEPMGFDGNDHVIEFNEIRDVCTDADDSGGIHQGRDWTWRGNVIRYNFFHHIGGGGHIGNQGVYLDDMQCGTEVYGNVFYRIQRANLFGGGRDNTLENNIMVDCASPADIDNRAMNWAKYHVDTTMKTRLQEMPYQAEPWRSRYPKLVGIWEDEPGVPKGNVVRRNLMVRCGPMHLAKEVTQFGTIENNLAVDADPGFVDPARLDFRLKNPAAVQAKIPGFQIIPFERIGLRVDADRPALPVGNPIINPQAQAFVEEIAVTIAPGRGAQDVVIRYTLDGSEPTPASPVSTGPILLKQTATVKAVAYPKSGATRGRSGVVSAAFSCYRLGANAGVFLSDLPALDPKAHGGLKVNVNYAGKDPIRLAGKTYEKGLMLCPAAGPEGGRGQVTYELKGGLSKATTFRATIGIDDTVAPRGSATFAVEVEQGGKWERVFESPALKGGEAREIAVPLRGATRLRLLTTDAGDNIHADHAVWAGAILQ